MSEKKAYTPQQIEFAMRYYMPTSKTYSNALQSALKVGFSENYAKNITTKDLNWLKKIVVEIVGVPTDKKNMVIKAKKVLDKTLTSKDERLAQDTAKFITKTTTEFSEKSDVTSGGEKINVSLVEFIDVGGKKDSKK